MAERTPPPIGRWPAKVIDHDLGKSSKGTPTAAILFEFQDSEDVTHRITAYLHFSPDTIAAEHGVVKQFRELGFDLDKNNWAIEKIAKKSAMNPDGGALMGLEADITIEDVDYEGKKQRKVRWINAPGSGIGMKDHADTPEKLKEIAGYVRSIAGGASVPKPAAPTQTAAAATREKTEVASGKSAPVAAPKSSKPADDLPF